MHVGHGRGAALGDSLALILAHLGHRVTREFYINDAGTQVQMLGESVRARALEKQGQPLQLPEQGYHGDYLIPVAEAYLTAHPSSLDDRAAILEFSLRKMIERIRQDLDDFGVHFDSWFSENSLLKKGAVEAHISTLRERGYVKEHDEATWFEAPGEDDEEKDSPSGALLEGSPASKKKVERDKDRVLKRRDGRWDLFCHRYRLPRRQVSTGI